MRIGIQVMGIVFLLMGSASAQEEDLTEVRDRSWRSFIHAIYTKDQWSSVTSFTNKLVVKFAEQTLEEAEYSTLTFAEEEEFIPLSETMDQFEKLPEEMQWPILEQAMMMESLTVTDFAQLLNQKWTDINLEASKKISNTHSYAAGILPNGLFPFSYESAQQQFAHQIVATLDGLAVPASPTIPLSGSTSVETGVRTLVEHIVMSESENQPYQGHVAVASVILNRVDHPDHPDTIQDVIYYPNAFSPVTYGTVWLKSPTSEVKRAVDAALAGEDPTYGRTFFWNPETSGCPPAWSDGFYIGDHWFSHFPPCQGY